MYLFPFSGWWLIGRQGVLWGRGGGVGNNWDGLNVGSTGGRWNANKLDGLHLVSEKETVSICTLSSWR